MSNEDEQIRPALRQQQRNQNAALIGGIVGGAIVDRHYAKKDAKRQAEEEAWWEAEQDRLAAEQYAREEEARQEARQQATALSAQQYGHGLAMWVQTPLGQSYTEVSEDAQAALSLLDARDHSWRGAWHGSVRDDGLMDAPAPAPVTTTPPEPTFAVILSGLAAIPFAWNVVAWAWNHSWFTDSKEEVFKSSLYREGVDLNAYRGTRDFWTNPSMYVAIALVVLAVILGVRYWLADRAYYKARGEDSSAASSAAKEAAGARIDRYGFDPLVEDATTVKPWAHDVHAAGIARRRLRDFLDLPYTAIREPHLADIQSALGTVLVRDDNPSEFPAPVLARLEEFRQK